MNTTIQALYMNTRIHALDSYQNLYSTIKSPAYKNVQSNELFYKLRQLSDAIIDKLE